MKMKRPLLVTLAAAAVAAVSGTFLHEAISQPATNTAPATNPTTNNVVTPPPPKPLSQAAQDLKREIPLDPEKLGDPLPRNLFVELSKLINPTVVSITTSQAPRNMQRNRDPLQEFLEDFWGNRGQGGGGPGGGGGLGGPPSQRRQQPVQALGTGFIIREDGLIITNNHVVAQASTIKVQFEPNSDKFYEATVVGSDNLTDIALIKIDAKRTLPFARLGSSKEVQVGEWVAAFGNPYGHAHTMTKGIISAIGREIAEINRFPFIQTDASINPGNSGGPLVNTQGLVIGVNTAIDARAQGIGFAIPIDYVKQVVGVLEKEGRVRRGFLGVNIASVDDQVAQQLGLEEATGAIVAEIVRGGPADKAGIQPYDIIVDVGGKKIGNPAELMNTVASLDIGSTTKVKIWRFDQNGKRTEKIVSVKVNENPDDRKQAAKPSAKKYYGQKAPFELGFKISDWTSELATENEINEAAPRNPIVTEVDGNSPAAVAGFRPGDMILDVNRAATPKAADVLRNLKKGRNIVRLMRGSTVVIITIGR